jgi:hypothetical protein
MSRPAGGGEQGTARRTSTGSPRMQTARPFAHQGTAWPPHASRRADSSERGTSRRAERWGTFGPALLRGQNGLDRTPLGHLSTPLHPGCRGPTKGRQGEKGPGTGPPAGRGERKPLAHPSTGLPGMHQRSTTVPFGGGAQSRPRAAKTSERGDIPPGRCVGGRAGPVAFKRRRGAPARPSPRRRATRAGSARGRAAGR